MSFPKYEKFIADQKYSRISQLINNNSNNNTNTQENINNLISYIQNLNKSPRYPLIPEIKNLYLNSYYGNL